MRHFVLSLGLLASCFALQPDLATADHRRPSYGAGLVNPSLGYISPSSHSVGYHSLGSTSYGYQPIGSPSYGHPGYGGPSYGYSGYSYSQPYLASFIRDCFLTYLGREPGEEGIRVWTEHVYYRGGTLEEVRIGVMSSPECFARFQNNPALYTQFLITQIAGRHPSPQELNFWVSLFHNRYQGNLNYYVRDLITNLG